MVTRDRKKEAYEKFARLMQIGVFHANARRHTSYAVHHGDTHHSVPTLDAAHAMKEAIKLDRDYDPCIPVTIDLVTVAVSTQGIDV